jgi:ferritin-like metal-binding protein YciE
MAETVHDRINAYIQDAISAERNFEDALRSFGKAGVQPEVQTMLSGFSAKAATQHERLTALLEARGGKPSSGKTALAESLAFSPLSAQVGQGEAEKNTQHLMITFAAAAAEMAMYESLASAATEAGDQQVVSLSQTLQREEHDDYKDVWSILRQSARSAFASEVGNGRTPEQIIKTYLQDAIAAEKTFETQLEGFAKEGDNQSVQTLFAQHARETHTQHEELTARLNALGGSTSALKTAVAHIFGFAPKVAQIGHDATERLTQNLMMAYAVENAEVAMYESLAEASRAAGDTTTEQLALSIQQQEKATADKVWAHIAPNASQAIARVRQSATS